MPKTILSWPIYMQPPGGGVTQVKIYVIIKTSETESVYKK